MINFHFLIKFHGFFFFFFNFYFFITYFFLPKICYNIKFRKKKIIFDNQKKNQINFEKNNIFFFLNNSYKTFCLNFEIFINKKLFIYKNNQNLKIKEVPLINTNLKNKINEFLNQKFILFKKVFI